LESFPAYNPSGQNPQAQTEVL